MAEFDALKINPSFPETSGGWNEFTKEVSEVIGQLNTSITTNKLTINNGDLLVGNQPKGGNKIILTSVHTHHFIQANNWWTEFVSHPNEGWKFKDGINDSSKLIIEAGTGNVGIGTDKPSGKIHIKGDAGILNMEGKTHSYIQFYPKGAESGRKAWIGFGTAKVPNQDSLSIMNENNHSLFLGTKGVTRLTIDKDGKVGVGTPTPSHKLHVKGDLKIEGGWIRVMGDKGILFEKHGGGFYMNEPDWIRVYGSKSLSVQKDLQIENGWLRVKGEKGIFFQKYGGGFHMTDKTWVRVYNGKSFYVNKDLKVDGNSTFNNLTAKGMIEAKGRVTKTYGAGYYKGARTGSHKGTWDSTKDPATETVSIYAHDRIVGNRIVSCSDKRLKIEINDIVSSGIVDQLNRLKVKKYYLKKELGLENIGFIAQEVEKVLPDAVDKIAGVAPNICKLVKIINVNKDCIIIQKEDIKVSIGDVVRLVTDESHDVEVVKVTKDTFSVKKWTEEELEEVFVYGTKMNDLRAIDYRYIFTMNVAATQYLSKQVQLLQQEMKRMKRQWNQVPKGMVPMPA